MGHGVYIQVTIPVRGHQGVVELAKRSLKAEWRFKFESREADRFLEDLAAGIGYSWGNEGDVIIWGMVGNWTDPHKFAEALLPFWEELLVTPHEDYPEPEYNIVIIYQVRDESAGSIQIGFDDAESEARELIVQRFDGLPFSWNT